MPAEDITSNIPEATIHIDVHLADDFSIEQARDMLVQMAVATNRLVGIGLMRKMLTSSHPVTQSLMATAAHAEITLNNIDQAIAAQRQQSGIVAPNLQMMPGGRRN